MTESRVDSMSLAFLFSVALLGQAASPSPATAPTRNATRLKWLADLGAESLAASSRVSEATQRPFVISVPAAAYLFSVGSDGSLQKRRRLAADEGAPYGVSVTDFGLSLATKEGSLDLWTFPPGGGLQLRWRRDLGERTSSIGWDGGDILVIATWGNRLMGLSAADGRTLWTLDIGGRAEAPPLIDGKDIFVATKAKALFRVDAATGRARWKVALPGLALHPLALLGREPHVLVCGTWDGQLLAHKTLTGQLLWSVSLPAKLSGPPVATNDLVVAVTADGSVQAYDPAGKLAWTQPGSSEGVATLLIQPGSPAPRLLVVSKMLVALDINTGSRLSEYPKGAIEELRRRFADAMLDGVKTYSEGEKRSLLARDAFEVAGAPFGLARLVGPQLAYGTEEGWAYLFDASTLRPLGRYHAGQPCTTAPRLAAGRVVATAGEDIFGMDPDTGQTVWKRALGADPQRIVGEATLGLVTRERVHALEAVGGVPQWSLRGKLRSVSPPAAGQPSTVPWLADDGQGNLRALWPPGRLGEEALPVEGELLPLSALGARSWVAATREGKVLVVTWLEEPPGGRLVTTWEKTFDEHIVDVRPAGERIAVRSETGSLIGLDESHQEIWRLHLSSGDRFEMVPEAGSLVIMSAADLRVHDWNSGETRLLWKVESPAVGAYLRGGTLLWVDRVGNAHAVDIQEGRLIETTDLGASLAVAAPTRDGFLITTTAGEVGLVHMAPGEPVAPETKGAVKGGVGQ